MTTDIPTRTRMFLDNQPLVGWFVQKAKHKVPKSCLDDLEGELRIVLWRCTEHFDPSKGYRFSTYVTNSFWRACSNVLRKWRSGARTLTMTDMERKRRDVLDYRSLDFVADPEVNVIDVRDEFARVMACSERAGLTETETDAWQGIVDGRSMREHAREMGCTVQNVNHSRNRAIEKVRSVMV